jgi:transcriptional regulator with XRE-family HTH domain
MTDQEFLNNLGNNISTLRKGCGMSQVDLGAIIDMEKSYLSTIENGHQNPSALTLKKIADAIGCNISDFFEV